MQTAAYASIQRVERLCATTCSAAVAATGNYSVSTTAVDRWHNTTKQQHASTWAYQVWHELFTYYKRSV